MRQNRRDPQDPAHIAVWASPTNYTRKARRMAGFRQRAVLASALPTLPRFVRRHMAALVAVRPFTRRNRKARARIVRSMADRMNR